MLRPILCLLLLASWMLAQSPMVRESSTQTLTNKTISGASNTLSNVPQSAVTNLESDLSGKAASSHTHGEADLPAMKKSVVIASPTTGLSGYVQFTWATAVTLAKVSCSTDQGTVTIQLDERAEGTPNTTGTSVLTAALVCDDSTESTTAFANAGIAADAPVALLISATSGTPNVVRVHVEY